MDNLSPKAKIIITLVVTGLILLTYAAIALYKLLAPYAVQIGIGVLAVVGVALVYLVYHQWYLGHMHRTMQKETVRQIAEQIRRENELLEHQKAAKTLELDYQQEIRRSEIRLREKEITLEQMKVTLEHERLMAAQQHITVPNGSMLVSAAPDDYRTIAYNAPAQIAQRAGQQGVNQGDDFVKPVAPDFIAMRHLITIDRMPLCWTASGPAYGTIDDLLSMAITGKPGRGKTTALMYFVALLLAVGAEVFVWDPHGTMTGLAVLNNRPLPGMPKSARLVYLDRKEDIVHSVPVLQAKIVARDEEYRQDRKANRNFVNDVWQKPPLLLLADELPVLSEYDDQVVAEYKILNKRLAKDDKEPEEVPSLIDLAKRFVLEARKWRCFFIGSGQSIDAEILPTRVTDALNSRIVFFNSERKARMSGLETDAIKNLLPLIRRAGSGVMIFDCARWDEPVIGAIPNITIGDLLDFLGVVIDSTVEERRTGPLLADGRASGVNGRPDLERSEPPFLGGPNRQLEASEMVENGLDKTVDDRATSRPQNDINRLVDELGDTPEERPAFLMMDKTQEVQFIALFPEIGSVDKTLDRITGCNHRHREHARELIRQHNLKKKG
jgi:hypothetical protein